MTTESQAPPLCPFPASHWVMAPCWEQEAHRGLSVPQMKGPEARHKGRRQGNRSPLTLPGATRGDSEELKPSPGSGLQTDGSVPSQGVGFKKCIRQGCLHACTEGPSHTARGCVCGGCVEIGTAAQKISLAVRFKSCKKKSVFFDPVILLLEICPKKTIWNADKNVYSWVFPAALFIRVKNWKPLNAPLWGIS